MGQPMNFHFSGDTAIDSVCFVRTHSKTYTITSEESSPCRGGGEEWERIRA